MTNWFSMIRPPQRDGIYALRSRGNRPPRYAAFRRSGIAWGTPQPFVQHFNTEDCDERARSMNGEVEWRELSADELAALTPEARARATGLCWDEEEAAPS